MKSPRMQTDLPILRFAPSPNGQLHLGHAYSALLNDALAKRLHGRLLLRMEDIDITRCTAQLAQGCLNDRAWLDLRWESLVRVQSEHWNDYSQALEKLKQAGLLYPCFCSRQQVAQHSHASDPDGAPLYAGTCRSLEQQDINARIAAGQPHSWRLNMQAALRHIGNRALSYPCLRLPEMIIETCTAQPQRWGDAIIARKDVPTSYHLSVVVDDALQAITHVVRGKDLEAATCLHVLLQALLGLPTPIYSHHPLLTEASGQKLSKSNKSPGLAALREQGISPAMIRQQIADFDSTGLLV